MKCPKCGNEMENLGNTSGIVLTTYPAQWDETHICRKDKVRSTHRVHAQLPPDYGWVSDFQEVAPHEQG